MDKRMDKRVFTQKHLKNIIKQMSLPEVYIESDVQDVSIFESNFKAG